MLSDLMATPAARGHRPRLARPTAPVAPSAGRCRRPSPSAYRRRKGASAAARGLASRQHPWRSARSACLAAKAVPAAQGHPAVAVARRPHPRPHPPARSVVSRPRHHRRQVRALSAGSDMSNVHHVERLSMRRFSHLCPARLANAGVSCVERFSSAVVPAEAGTQSTPLIGFTVG